MYGYVRPLKPELKIREFERYQAVYCGLCHALAKRFGLLARFCVNYDMTLPILLASDSAPTVCRKRCIAHPLKKRCVICASPVLDRAADMTMILAYHKLSDTVADSRGLKRLGARIGRFFFRRGYQRAAAREAEFDAVVRENLAGLAELEATLTAADAAAALDKTAACFAEVTAGFALLAPEQARIWREIFYHVGRYVYILDAADDAPKDFQQKNFNPLILRYGMTEPQLDAAMQAEITQTLELSLSLASSAFELLDANAHTPICANILYLGLPAVIRAVFAGTHRKKRRFWRKQNI